MGGHFFSQGVAVIMAVVGNEAALTGMLKSSDFAEEF